MPHRISIYPHNDLFNLAHYHCETINRKVCEGVEDAISLDCMSCLIALAFAIEALVNFVGSSVIKDWQERQSYQAKLEQIGAAIGLSFDRKIEPFLTVWALA